MASESVSPPPSSSGGSAKYVIILLLLLGGGLGVYLATSGEEPKPTPPPVVKSPERSTSLATNTIEIPPEEPDTGVEPEPEPEPVKRPRTTQDPWACPGDIPVSDIKKVLNDAQSSIRACYERALRNNNQLQGSVNLEVRVGASGRVDNSRIRGNLRDAEVTKCIQNLTKTWSFPAPTGGSCAVVGAPYNFTPKN